MHKGAERWCEHAFQSVGGYIGVWVGFYRQVFWIVGGYRGGAVGRQVKKWDWEGFLASCQCILSVGMSKIVMISLWFALTS